jgi:hypothetical protein
MQNALFSDVTPCGSCKNRRFRGTNRLHHQDHNIRWTRNKVISNSNRNTKRRNGNSSNSNSNSNSVLRMLVTANGVLSSAIHVTRMMEAIRSPETSGLNNSHAAQYLSRPHSSWSSRQNLKSYRALTGWTL